MRDSRQSISSRRRIPRSPVLWNGDLKEEDLIGEGEPGIEAKLTELGHGTTVTGELRMKVVRGPEAGKVVVTVVRY